MANGKRENLQNVRTRGQASATTSRAFGGNIRRQAARRATSSTRSVAKRR